MTPIRARSGGCTVLLGRPGPRPSSPDVRRSFYVAHPQNRTRARNGQSTAAAVGLPNQPAIPASVPATSPRPSPMDW